MAIIAWKDGHTVHLGCKAADLAGRTLPTSEEATESLLHSNSGVRLPVAIAEVEVELGAISGRYNACAGGVDGYRRVSPDGWICSPRWVLVR